MLLSQAFALMPDATATRNVINYSYEGGIFLNRARLCVRAMANKISMKPVSPILGHGIRNARDQPQNMKWLVKLTLMCFLVWVLCSADGKDELCKLYTLTVTLHDISRTASLTFWLFFNVPRRR